MELWLVGMLIPERRLSGNSLAIVNNPARL
jgi:hypothetical protein